MSTRAAPELRLAPQVVDNAAIQGGSALPAASPQWASRQNVSMEHPNEDCAFSGTGMFWSEQGEEMTFYIAGVADGHGGQGACSLVAEKVVDLISESIASCMGQTRPGIEEAFAQLEGACLALEDESGACVCVCLVGRGIVWCANLGDCRAVLLGWDGEACALSVDHRAGEGKEKERILDAGGAVEGNTVQGLMPSRTLGDADVKRRCPPGVVLATPELRACEGEGLVVLGSDGLWDVLSVMDVVHLLPPGRARKRAAQDADMLKAISDELVDAAIRRGAHDDVTAMVFPVL